MNQAWTPILKTLQEKLETYVGVSVFFLEQKNISASFVYVSMSHACLLSARTLQYL